MAKGFSAPVNRENLVREWVSVDVNGQPMRAYLARPNGNGRWPAVIVLMEIFGVNTHIREVTERIAAEGYAAIAPNYYHRTTENLELGYTERDMVTGRKNKEQTTRQGVIDDLKATIQFLRQGTFVEHPGQLGCVGFCFGGHVAFIAATLPEVVATAAFYPGGVATSSPGGGEPTINYASDIHGEILCLFGMEDPLISSEDNHKVEQALRQASRNYEVIRYANTGHGFFCDQRGDFDPSAAEDAWERIQALFAKNLRSEK